MRKFTLIIIYVLFQLSGAILHAETQVKVGVYQNEPKVFMDDTGKAQGVFVDIIEYIANEEQWSLQYVPGAWSECLDRLVNGEIDLMMDIAYSQERTLKFDFSEETVLSNWAQVYVSEESDIQSYLDLEGKSVAALKGDISYERFISTVEQFGINCHFVETDEYIEIFRLVDSGAADAGIISHFFGLKREKEFNVVKSPIIFNPMELRFATSKGNNGHLLTAIDRHVRAMKGDQESVYHISRNKWLVTDFESRNDVPNWVWWTLGAIGFTIAFFFLHHTLLHTRLKIMTAELRENNDRLMDEIAVRISTEKELTKHREHLEEMVEERTRDLRESEERARSIFENATMGIFRTSAAGSILTTNPAGAAILGYDSVEEGIEAITDLAQQIYADPADRQKILELLQKQGKATLDVPLRRKDNTTLDAKLNLWTVTDDEGNLRFIEGFIEDITERKQAEEKLRLYHRVFMASTDGINITDLEGNLLEFNPAMLVESGYTAEEYREIDIRDIYADDTSEIADSMRATLTFQGEVRIKRKDGSLANVDLSIFPILHEDGAPSCLVGIGHDITERKRAEELVQRSEKKYRELVQNANSIIMRMDTQGRITFFNEFAQSFFGYTEEEILGQNAVGTVVPETGKEAEDMLRLLKNIGQNPEDYANYESQNTRRSGEQAWVAWANRPIFDSGGQLVEVLCIGNDISELRQARSNLEEAYRNLQKTQTRLIQSEKMAALGMLVAGVAHEFNNPISAVQSASDTLETGIGKFEVLCGEQMGKMSVEEKKVLAVIKSCQRIIASGTERVASIVSKMKAFARLDEAEIQRVNINQNLEDTIAVFQHEIKSGIALRRDLQEIPMLICSPAKLNQLFIQLLRNANQACEDGGEIFISSHSDGKAIYVTISDTGQGIPEEILDRIFDPGFTTRSGGVGVGLGLSISYQIAQEHRGRIDVESEVGKGSKFVVVLPLN